MRVSRQQPQAIFGSLPMAVGLLLAIGGVLAYGTIYETRFGTPAVQRFIYTSWWFQALLGFLALNLAVVALSRRPWRKRHVPFLLAHLGIILLLAGGVISGRFGIEGQVIIPEGEAARILHLPTKVLAVRQTNPGIEHVIPTRFESQAWVRRPQATFPLDLEEGRVELTVDRYYPNAAVTERIELTDGTSPAVHLQLRAQDQTEAVWLVADDPERFGASWGPLHVLFLAPDTQELLDRLTAPAAPAADRGVLDVTLPDRATVSVPVPDTLGQPIRLGETPYILEFRDYFPDFALTELGVGSRSEAPNNPAISLTLTGPEGTDARLVFAQHPDFEAVHPQTLKIPATLRYRHDVTVPLPPDALVLLRRPNDTLTVILTGPRGERRPLESIAAGIRYAHPWTEVAFELLAHSDEAQVIREVEGRGSTVRAEALHVILRSGDAESSAWVGVSDPRELRLGKDTIRVEYRPAQRVLPFLVKLLDFRKIDYPGTTMAAGFESDVEVTDPERGIILLRTIKMNEPLRYRGYSLYQASYIEGPVETTVLAVRNDPGTLFVYAGGLIVLAGILGMFLFSPSKGREPTS